MSHKYDAEVDTQREYFNTAYFNTTGTDQLAKYETTLLKPFFNNPDKWKLSINRARVPLNGIPLTANNIPFNQWWVALYFQTDKTGTGKYLSESYVPQYNQAFETGNYAYNINTNLEMEIILGYSTGFKVYKTYPTQNTTTINSLGQTISPIMAVIGTRAIAFFLDSQTDNTIRIYDATRGILLSSLTINFININAMCVDADGNIYIGYTTPGPIFSVQQYNADVNFNYTLQGSSICALAGPGLYFNAMIALSVGTVLVAIQFPNKYGGNSAPQFLSGVIGGGDLDEVNTMGQDTGNNQFLTGITLSTGTLFFNINQLINSVMVPTLFAAPDSLGSSNLIGTLSSFNYFCGNDGNNFLMNGGYNGHVDYNAYTGDTTGINFIYHYVPPNGSYSLATSTNAYSIIQDAGPYNIYSFQQYLTQINLAFQTAFTALLAIRPTLKPTEAPSISYNGATKLFSLNCEGSYMTLNADGSQQCQILLNNNLFQKFLFPAQQFIDPYPYNPLIGLYYSIILANYGYNSVVGTGSSTLPQFLYMQQEQSTIYALNDLTRIIIGTTQIPVSGDGEGTLFTNSGATNNRSLNMITDFIPDTTVITNAEPIIYVPNGILRWYNMYAQQPFTKIDLIFYYETKDGLIRPVIITNGEYFSCKLEFKRGPGDF
jgi:hypothetical protein